jgi:hypothetical protein
VLSCVPANICSTSCGVATLEKAHEFTAAKTIYLLSNNPHGLGHRLDAKKLASHLHMQLINSSFDTHEKSKIFIFWAWTNLRSFSTDFPGLLWGHMIMKKTQGEEADNGCCPLYIYIYIHIYIYIYIYI